MFPHFSAHQGCSQRPGQVVAERQGFEHPRVDHKASPFQARLLCLRALPHLLEDHRPPPSYGKRALPGHEGITAIHTLRSPQGEGRPAAAETQQPGTWLPGGPCSCTAHPASLRLGWLHPRRAELHACAVPVPAQRSGAELHPDY